MSSRATVPTLDLAPPKPWRRFVPAWLRSLVWVDCARNYDAFLSYSWKSDNNIAPVIQSLIQRFLCPWYKLRAKTVFRDLSCLPAGSSLEGELFNRLDRSDHLIVLASPEAAVSHGMEVEAGHWFSCPRSGQVIIIVSSGNCKTWGEIRGHLLPPALVNNLTSEPLWITLQHRRDRILADPDDHQLREEIIEDLKQVLLRFYPGRDWGQLRGDERRQRRRLIFFLAAVGCLFLLLALTAAGFAWYAQKQRVAAERQARSATSRSLGLEASTIRASDPALGLLLALAAVEIQDNAQARGSLFMSLNSLSAMAAAQLGGSDHATALAASPAGNLFAVGDEQGVVRVCEVASTRCLHEVTLPSRTEVTALAFDSKAEKLAIGDAKGDLAVWEVVNGTRVDLDSGNKGKIEYVVSYVAFSEDGRKLAAAASKQNDGWRVAIWAADGSAAPVEIRRSVDWIGVEHLGWRGNYTLVVADYGDVVLFSASGARVGQRELMRAPRPGQSAYNPDGTLGAVSELDTGRIELRPPLPPDNDFIELTRVQIEHPTRLIQVNKGFIDSLAFSNDSSKLAVAQAGVLTVFDDQGSRLRQIEGLPRGTGAIVFASDSESVATLSDSKVQVWRLNPVNQLKHTIRTAVDVPTAIQSVVGGAFRPDGKQLAWVVPTADLSGWALAVWDADTNTVTHHAVATESEEPPDSLRFVSTQQLAFVSTMQLESGRSRSPVRLIDLSSGKISPSPCVATLPGSEWLPEDKHKLVFRRCRGSRMETSDLQSPLRDLGFFDEAVVASTLSENGNRFLCITRRGELFVADPQSRVWKKLRLATLDAGLESAYVSNSGLLMSPNGQRVVLDFGEAGSLLVSIDDMLFRGSNGMIRSADLGITDALAFSRDGRWLAAVRAGGEISLWDADALVLLGTVSGQAARVHLVELSPTGRLLAELGPGGAATLWDLDPESWKRKACAAAGRGLSDSERLRYLPTDGYLFKVEACQSSARPSQRVR